jgi:nucleoside-diphosphate-sugar epimerase
MPSELIIGATGFIGSSLAAHLPDAILSSRGEKPEPHWHTFDLVNPGKDELPSDVDIVYLCAGINGTLTCARDPQISYRTNVDGTIYIAEYYSYRAFVVWVSSTTVEWLTEHYGRQKRIAENHLRMLPHVGIVRAGRVLRDNVDDLCRVLIDIGRNRRRGIVIWGEDERPYER